MNLFVLFPKLNLVNIIKLEYSELKGISLMNSPIHRVPTYHKWRQNGGKFSQYW